MKTLLIGNSEHLGNIIRKIYPSNEIKTIPWRRKFEENFSERYDLIFIIGFDFDSFNKKYIEYLIVNIYNPLLTIKNYSKSTTDLVLISTSQGKRKFTLSRYRYAKELLSDKLMSSHINFYVLRFDTFIDKYKFPMIKGNILTKVIFKCLSEIKAIKTTDMAAVSQKIEGYKKYKMNKPSNIKGILLDLKRTQFLDRLARFFIA